MKKTLFLIIINAVFMTGCSNSEPTQPESETVAVIEENIEEELSDVAEEIIYGTDFESTWGDLTDSNGGELVWDTLTPYQQSLVNYPEFDSNNVYWTPKGSNYHAVDWCYTLSRSSSILNGSLNEALNLGYGPCSKCVGE